MSSTGSIEQYAARAEAAEAKIAELTALAAQIQAVAGGPPGGATGGEGIGEFKAYFLEKLKTLRGVVAEEHEEYLKTKAKNGELEKEVTKLKYRVEILTRELSAKLGTPVPESLFKDAPTEASGETKKEESKDKGKEKGKDKSKEKDDKAEKGKDKKDKGKERKPSEKAERKPSERKPSEKAETASQPNAQAVEPVTVHAAAGDKNKKDASAEQSKDNKKGKKSDKGKKDSSAEVESTESAPTEQAKKGGKKDDAKKGGDAKNDKPKAEAKSGDLDDKAVKAALKEGGKKGQDCAGMSTFGSHFFCVTIESADGNMKLLEKVMEGMNLEVDEEAEDRKGGAGDLGKILFNANDKKLVIMCHTPKEVIDKATAAEWMEPVLAATGAKVTSKTDNFIQAELDNDPDNGVFTLKRRDQGVSASFEFLRSKGLMIDDDSDDENYAAAAGINLNAAPGADY